MNTVVYIQQELDKIYKEDFCPKAERFGNTLIINLFWMATKKDIDLINTIVGKEYTYIDARYGCNGIGLVLCYIEEIDDDLLYDINRQYK